MGTYVTMDTYGIYAAASSGIEPVLRIQTTAYVTLPRALFLPGEKRRVAYCSFLWTLRPPLQIFNIISVKDESLSTYDHRSVKTGHPVRSAIHKH
jgi:hypothetical protein